MGSFRKIGLVAAIAARLLVPSHTATAQDYIVNDHPASLAEAQYLVAQGAAPGEWSSNGFGIVRTGNGPTRVAAQKCWYVLDVLLCDDAPASRTPPGTAMIAENTHASTRQSSAEED